MKYKEVRRWGEGCYRASGSGDSNRKLLSDTYCFRRDERSEGRRDLQEKQRT